MPNNIMDCFDNGNMFNIYKYFVFLNNKSGNYTVLAIKLDLELLHQKIKGIYNLKADSIFIGNGFEYKEFGKPPLKEEIHLMCVIKQDFMFLHTNNITKIWFSENIQQEEINKLIAIIEECRKPESIEYLFYTVAQNTFVGGFELKEFKIKETEVSINENYNDDFVPINEKVLEFINNDNQNGIVLFHGKYGTGKTTYIRYLITRTKKRVIYLPLSIFKMIGDPSFLPFLSDNTGSVWVIEDCEELVKSREISGDSSAISNLLNLGDGLLADALNIKIICTFNTELKNIDKALLRKGRLITRYEFGELSIEKTKLLLANNGVKNIEDKSLTLAEIYNYLEDNNGNIADENKIGFSTTGTPIGFIEVKF